VVVWLVAELVMVCWVEVLAALGWVGVGSWAVVRQAVEVGAALMG
jgi:hypothetical protein